MKSSVVGYDIRSSSCNEDALGTLSSWSTRGRFAFDSLSVCSSIQHGQRMEGRALYGNYLSAANPIMPVLGNALEALRDIEKRSHCLKKVGRQELE